MAELPEGSAGGYWLLRPDIGALAFRPDACLPQRTPLANCRACAEACPVDALHLSGGPTGLSDHCLSCGQCSAACPTGALHVPGFAVALGTVGPARLDCYRVRACDADGARVPCLGGLGTADLAELHRATGGDGPVLIDRGWCGDCPLGGARHPARETVDRVARLLGECGVDTERRPRIENQPLPLSNAQPALPNAADEVPVSRRGLLRRLVGQAGATAAALEANAEDAAPPRPLRHGITPAPRVRLLAALAELGPTPPPTLAAQLRVSEYCRDHGVCAALCPTGALDRTHDAAGSGLDFDPAVCIGCRLCERACPEQALTVTEQGGAPARQTLVRHRQRPCADCQRPFPAEATEDLCPTCRKARAFAREAASLFRAPRPERGSDATDPQEESA